LGIEVLMGLGKTSHIDVIAIVNDRGIWEVLSDARPHNRILEVALDEGVGDAVVPEGISSVDQPGLLALHIKRCDDLSFMINQKKLRIQAVEGLPRVLLCLLYKVPDSTHRVALVALE
jgi:hypothetical protein